MVTWLQCFGFRYGEVHHGKEHEVEPSGSAHGRQEAREI
jgi:hypothetical protein